MKPIMRQLAPKSARRFLMALLTIGMAAAAAAADAGPSDRPLPQGFLAGVNLSGAEVNRRGEHGVDYVYPVEPFSPGYTSPAYFVSKGLNAFRLPFQWERLQPRLGQPLDHDELTRLVAATRALRGLGATVVLDVHNYARYDDHLIGSDKVASADFADLWRRLAAQFKGDDGVILGLMNEPHHMKTEVWRDAANAAIRAIRDAGARNLILVPGNGWSGAHSWYDNSYGTPNAVALLDIHDPLDRVAFEAHLYLDHNASGLEATCLSEGIGVDRLAPFTRWLTEHNKRGFIGEFGGSRDQPCLKALSRMVRHMAERSDIYLGWTYWAAGPWWTDDYYTLIEPRDGQAPQLTALLPYLRPLSHPKRSRARS